MTTPVNTADVPRAVRAAVNKVIRKRFQDELVCIRFVDYEVGSTQCTITIEIELKDRTEPDHQSPGTSLFGLTRQVRNALGMGENVFPVLRPVATHA